MFLKVMNIFQQLLTPVELTPGRLVLYWRPRTGVAGVRFYKGILGLISFLVSFWKIIVTMIR